jgi:hypothetical protein
VPTYLPAVPTDPLTAGQPLIYAPDRGVVYSVGRDGKDDGGKLDVPGLNPDIVYPLR